MAGNDAAKDKYDSMSEDKVKDLYAQRISTPVVDKYDDMHPDDVRAAFDKLQQKQKTPMEAAQLSDENKQVIEGDPQRSLDIAAHITSNPNAQAAIATTIQMAPLALGLAGHVAGRFAAPEIKPNAQEIFDATKRISGAEPTPGMITKSPAVPAIEKSIMKSGTIPGMIARSGLEPIKTGVAETARSALADADMGSQYGSGLDMSKGAVAGVAERRQNVQDLYEPFDKELPKMKPDDGAKAQLQNKILKIGQKSVGDGVEAKASRLSDQVENSSNLEHIEDVRKKVGDLKRTAISNRQYNAADEFAKIEDAFHDFRDDQFVAQAQKSYPGPGGKILGDQMVAEYQNARQSHANLMNDLGEMGQVLGIKNKNPRAFVDAVAELPPEEFSKKLFNIKNHEKMLKAQEYFPDEFETARKFKLGEIQKNSLDDQGNIDPKKLVRQFGKLSPEAQGVLFGDKVQSIKDLATVLSHSTSDLTGREHISPDMGIVKQAVGLGQQTLYRALSPQYVNPQVESFTNYRNVPYANGMLQAAPAVRQIMSTTIRKRSDLEGNKTLPSKGK